MRRTNNFGNQEIFNSPIAAGPDAVWVASDTLASSSVQQVDPKSGDLVRAVDLDFSPAGMSQLAADSGMLWHAAIENETRRAVLTRIDARTGNVVGTLDLAFDSISAIETLGEGVWVFGSVAGGKFAPTLAKLDPATGKVVEQYPTGEALYSAKQIVFDLGRVWLYGKDDKGQGALVSIDRATKEVHAVDLGDWQPAGIALGDGPIWTLAWKDGAGSELVKLSPDGKAQKRVPTELPFVEDMLFDDETIWLLGGDGKSSTIERRDPETGKVLASTCSSVIAHNFAAAGGVAWISDSNGLARVEIKPGG